MRIALLSDIHGNIDALTAVLEDLGKNKVDKIVSLGDVIGYGPEPAECLRLVEEHCEIKLMGNHEFAVLGLINTDHYNSSAQEATEWTRSTLGDEEIAIIAEYEIDYCLNDIYLVHASPFEPDKWHYVAHSEEALVGFEQLKNRICFFGHTHIPLIFAESLEGLPWCRVGHSFEPDPDSRYMINVGAVGQPRDKDPRACYVIYDLEEGTVDYHRIEYDIQAAQARMTIAKLPTLLIDRLQVGR